MSNLIYNPQGVYEGHMAAGLRLADLAEEDGGWKHLFEGEGMEINDPWMRASTALMLENTKRWMCERAGRLRPNGNGRIVLDEATRSALVGGYSDYLFPIIRAAFPVSAINDLVAVQPTTRRTATVMYWNWVVGGDQPKGSFVPGQRLFDANRGKQDNGQYFTSEYIDGELIGTGNGAANPTLTSLVYRDGGGIRPSTVRVTATVAGAPATASDNGNGGWLGGLVGTIDYKTGAIAITWGGLTDASTPITAFYRWNSEGSNLIPQVDVQITTSTVETERRALKYNYSVESAQDAMAEFGINLEPNLMGAGAEQLNSEVARQLVSIMWGLAVPMTAFSLTVPAGISRLDHYKDFLVQLTGASNNIWGRTQKAYGNWLVVDEGGSNLVESMDQFVAAPRPASVQGLHFIGTLANKYRVYKDLHLGKEAGASAVGNVLMGFKGQEFWEAGLVYSPYRVLYTTDTLTTADMMAQKGMGSRYAVKTVNPDMYARISLAV